MHCDHTDDEHALLISRITDPETLENIDYWYERRFHGCILDWMNENWDQIDIPSDPRTNTIRFFLRVNRSRPDKRDL